MAMRRGVFNQFREDPRYIIRGNPQIDMLHTPAVHGINQPQLMRMKRSGPAYPIGLNLKATQRFDSLLPNQNLDVSRSSGGIASSVRGGRL